MQGLIISPPFMRPLRDLVELLGDCVLKPLVESVPITLGRPWLKETGVGLGFVQQFYEFVKAPIRDDRPLRSNRRETEVISTKPNYSPRRDHVYVTK